MNESQTPLSKETTTADRPANVLNLLDRETDREILAILVADSPRNVIDIARTADRHPITVDQTCARLHEQELIYPIGQGQYAVTDDGRHQIEAMSDGVVEP